MMDDEDFFLNDDDFDKDTELSELDKAKIKIIDCMIRNLNEMRESLQYNERSEARTGFDIVSNNYTKLIELFKIDEKDISPEELSAIIKKVNAQTENMTLENQDDILGALSDDEGGLGIDDDDEKPNDEEGNNDADSSNLEW